MPTVINSPAREDNVFRNNFLSLRKVEARTVSFNIMPNQCKDEVGVAFQLVGQIVTAGSNKLACLNFSEHTAIFKGVADLRIQFVAISQDHDSR